jgi:hypothetical protein
MGRRFRETWIRAAAMTQGPKIQWREVPENEDMTQDKRFKECEHSGETAWA